MVSRKSGLTIGILALAISFSSLSANDLPKEEEEGMVLESVFIDSAGEKDASGSTQAEDTQGSISPSSSLLMDGEPEKKTKRKHRPKSHLDGKLSLGKGEKLSDEEINLSLLVFAKEEEVKKRAFIEAQEKKKKEEEEAQKMLAESQLSNVETVASSGFSIEEQKARVSAGLSQFPDATDALVPLETIMEEVSTPSVVNFYGASCVDGKCVVLADGGSYKVGDIIFGDEKVLSITKDKIKTTTREVNFRDVVVVVPVAIQNEQ